MLISVKFPLFMYTIFSYKLLKQPNVIYCPLNAIVSIIL